VFSTDERGNLDNTYGWFLGPSVSVAEAERMAISQALEKKDHSMLAIS